MQTDRIRSRDYRAGNNIITIYQASRYRFTDTVNIYRGSCDKAIIKTLVAVRRVGIITTPNHPM
jgi:hypothetical protein